MILKREEKKTLGKIFQFFENSPFPFRTAKRRGIFFGNFYILYFIVFFWVLYYVEPSYYYSLGITHHDCSPQDWVSTVFRASLAVTKHYSSWVGLNQTLFFKYREHYHAC